MTGWLEQSYCCGNPQARAGSDTSTSCTSWAVCSRTYHPSSHKLRPWVNEQGGHIAGSGINSFCFCFCGGGFCCCYWLS
jgi:hypothetical protein